MFEPVAESKIRQGTHVCIFPCFSLFSFQGPNFSSAQNEPTSNYQTFVRPCRWLFSAASEKLSTPRHPKGSTSFFRKSALPSETIVHGSRSAGLVGACTGRSGLPIAFYFPDRAVGLGGGGGGIDSPAGSGSSSVALGMSGGLIAASSGGAGGSKLSPKRTAVPRTA